MGLINPLTQIIIEEPCSKLQGISQM